MADVNLKRKAEFDGEKAIIRSEVVESMPPMEYKQLFHKKSKDLNALEFSLRDAKNRLQQLDVEPTEELEEFMEMLDKVDDLRQKRELQDKIKEMEKTRNRLESEVTALKEVYKELNEQRG